MKKWIFGILLLSLNSFPATATPPSLQDNMKELGTLFKQLGADVGNPAKNQGSVASAARMVALFTTALDQTPDAIASLPPNQRAAAIADYKSILQIEIKDATDLQSAFLKNDNNGAVGILTRMGAGKKEGHTKYKN